MNLEFVMLHIHLNANDYSLKFHVPELSKVPCIAIGL